MYKMGLEKAEKPEIKLPTFVESQRKQGNSRKSSIYASLTTLKPLTVWITTNCGKFFRRWEYQTTLPASWEICMQVKKQQLKANIEQKTISKLRMEYIKVIILTPCLFNLYVGYIMWNVRLGEAQAGIKIAGEVSITSDMQMTPPLWQKVKNWRVSWWKWERRVKKLA